LIAAQDSALLLSKGITHVLSLTSEVVQIPTETGIVHKQFRVRDTRKQNLLQYLLDGVQFIEDAFLGMLSSELETSNKEPAKDVKVFVHCRMGISRSGSVVIAYVMKHHDLTYRLARELVKSKRSIVHPNHAFVVQLQLLKDCNFDLTHLGPELLEQQIENPYNPNEFDEEYIRQARKEKKKEELLPVWERTGQWAEVKFADKQQSARFYDAIFKLAEKGVFQDRLQRNADPKAKGSPAATDAEGTAQLPAPVVPNAMDIDPAPETGLKNAPGAKDS